ncbi:MAG: ankyrin repeat domain-containing protein [Spirochaetota bacterium]
MNAEITLKQWLNNSGFSDIQSTDEEGNPPLYLAISQSLTEIIRMLLEAGADANAHTKTNITPLHWAARYGRTEIVRMLLEAGADANTQTKSPFKPDDPFFNLRLPFDSYGKTPLHFVVMSCRTVCPTETVRILVEAGADVNATDEHGVAPLHWAALRQDLTETVRILVEAGADVNAQIKSNDDPISDYGDHPLHLAARNGHTEAVRILVEARSNVNSTNKFGETPLYIAARSHHKEVIDYLRSVGGKYLRLTLFIKQCLKLFNRGKR